MALPFSCTASIKTASHRLPMIICGPCGFRFVVRQFCTPTAGPRRIRDRCPVGHRLVWMPELLQREYLCRACSIALAAQCNGRPSQRRKLPRAPVLCQPQAIGARRCQRILINVGADLLHDVCAPRHTRQTKISFGARFVPHLFGQRRPSSSVSIFRRISRLVARLTEQGATDRPMAR
jgi:hypothetical protein